jgi:hypothetical protein
MLICMFGTLIDGICLMIVHHWYYLISTTIGICLRYMVMPLGGILVDAHCLAYL